MEKSIKYLAIYIGVVGLSFLLMWPVTIFINYMITVFGGTFAFKLWQLWGCVFVFNLLFKKSNKTK